MIPLPTRIPLILSPPIHLYELVQVSKDFKLALMRTGYHESMPYHLNDADERAYLYTYKSKSGSDDIDLLSVTGGAKYLLGLNGALANDFEFCPGIVTKANNKHYVLEEASLKGLVDDYDKCRN